LHSIVVSYIHMIASQSHKLPISLFLYYNTSVHNLNNHSFPTRRSSDLRQEREERRAGDRGPVLAARRERQRESERADECGDADADRKSTRLNSSHSQISYAVFCLKKKKN